MGLEGPVADYYRVLGVERTATNEEIRKAFQQLAKELHPDTNPNQVSTQRFQAAKEAYDVLRTDSKKRAYDAKLNGRYGAPADPYEAERLRRRAQEFDRTFRPNGPSAQTRAMRVLEQLLRPRVLFAVPFIAAASWYLTAKYSDVQYTEPGDSVKAWFNPVSLRWETPAPWDPLYHANVHTTKNVPRRHVHASSPPVGAPHNPPSSVIR